MMGNANHTITAITAIRFDGKPRGATAAMTQINEPTFDTERNAIVAKINTVMEATEAQDPDIDAGDWDLYFYDSYLFSGRM